MTQLAQLIDTHGVDVHDYLDRELDIPIHTGLQRQGDVIVVPTSGMDLFETTRTNPWASTPVPPTGTPVVRGEAGGNTHAIVTDGNVHCDVRQTVNVRDLTVATLTIAEGSTAYLTHPEHGYMGIGPGNYTIRRQREQADELRVVAD